MWSRKFATGGGTETLKRGNIDNHLGRVERGFVRDSDAPHQYRNGPPPAPAADLRRFAGERSYRTPDFLESDLSDKPPYVRDQAPLGADDVDRIDREHRGRLASLQVVDRAVGQLVDKLEESGELDNTYIFFTTDNGYHMGEHGMEQGKMTPYLTDVRFPLIVRGPGVERGAVRQEIVQNTDFAPTVADLAGADAPASVDGRSMVPLLKGEAVQWRSYGLLEGAWYREWTGAYSGEAEYVRNPGGFEELYDLETDPHQLDNLLHEPTPEAEARAAELEARLDALKDCSGDSCRAAENP